MVRCEVVRIFGVNTVIRFRCQYVSEGVKVVTYVLNSYVCLTLGIKMHIDKYFL